MSFTQPPQAESQVERFRKVFRDAGLPLTHQREVIYRTVLDMRNHPSPELIYDRVRQEIPSISLGTVYKNIRTFIESGLLREVSLHHGTLRLDANLGEHHHLVCSRCRAIVDLNEEDIEPLRLRRDPPAGFQVDRYSVEFQGLCAGCASETKQS